MKVSWYEGIDDYKLHTFEVGDNSSKNLHTVELLDKDVEEKPIDELIVDVLNIRQTKIVDILFSGGIDSELVLRTCLRHNIPVTINTMAFIYNGAIINTHDMYYSTKFCRENNLQHNVLTLDVGKFFENGDHLPYLVPYNNSIPHVATHYWLFEQMVNFPVGGGDYSWPWEHKPIISPHRYDYNCHSRFFKDKGIHGVGNLLNHSLSLNIAMMKLHKKYYKETVLFKTDIFSNAGFGPMEPRFRSYGWEKVTSELKYDMYTIDLIKRVGVNTSTIIWNNKIAEVLDGIPGSNDKYH